MSTSSNLVNFPLPYIWVIFELSFAVILGCFWIVLCRTFAVFAENNMLSAPPVASLGGLFGGGWVHEWECLDGSVLGHLMAPCPQWWYNLGQNCITDHGLRERHQPSVVTNLGDTIPDLNCITQADDNMSAEIFHPWEHGPYILWFNMTSYEYTFIYIYISGGPSGHGRFRSFFLS